MHWWAASQAAVHNWRKALGVGRTDCEGSRGLIQAAAEKGAEAVKEREWSEEERERHRQVNAKKGRAANPVLGYHGPLWTPEGIALHGTMPNEDMARQIGRTAGAVRQKREELVSRTRPGTGPLEGSSARGCAGTSSGLGVGTWSDMMPPVLRVHPR
jgi:hypothetical protein